MLYLSSSWCWVNNTNGIIIFLIFSVVSAISALSFASQYNITFYVSSHHFIDRKDKAEWNKENYGSAFERHAGNYFLESGCFKNSYFRDSFYSLIDRKIRYKKINFSSFIGVASGYPDILRWLC